MGLENDSWANWDPPSYKGYGQIGGDSEEKLEERKVSREEIMVYLWREMFSLRKSQVRFICKLLWDIQRGSTWKRCGTCGLWSWGILLWGINYTENDCFSGVFEPKRREWTTALLQKHFGSLPGSIHQFLFMCLVSSPDKLQWNRNHSFLVKSSFFSFKIWL